MVTAPLIWLLLAALLLLLAMAGADSDGLLLLAGLSALSLAAVTTLSALLPGGQLLLFTLLLLLGYRWLRRWSARRRERGIPPAAGSELAEVTADFDGEGCGRVRWQGQSWAAVSLEPTTPLTVGATVQVLGREGTRLQVLARASAAVSRRQEGGQPDKRDSGISRRTSD